MDNHQRFKLKYTFNIVGLQIFRKISFHCPFNHHIESLLLYCTYLFADWLFILSLIAFE